MRVPKVALEMTKHLSGVHLFYFLLKLWIGQAAKKMNKLKPSSLSFPTFQWSNVQQLVKEAKKSSQPGANQQLTSFSEKVSMNMEAVHFAKEIKEETTWQLFARRLRKMGKMIRRFRERMVKILIQPGSYAIFQDCLV